jgi:DNA-binding transcriptional ArsR family regulator/putative hemolysin
MKGIKRGCWKNNFMEFDGLTLSSGEMKALSSETRTGVLKLLKDKRYTLTELAVKKGIAVSSMKQQMKLLEETGLVEIFDEGRKWKYYSLTTKGKKIMGCSEQKPLNIALVLGTTLIVAVFASMLFLAINTPFPDMDHAFEQTVDGLKTMKTEVGTQPFEKDAHLYEDDVVRKETPGSPYGQETLQGAGQSRSLAEEPVEVNGQESNFFDGFQNIFPWISQQIGEGIMPAESKTMQTGVSDEQTEIANDSEQRKTMQTNAQELAILYENALEYCFLEGYFTAEKNGLVYCVFKDGTECEVSEFFAGNCVNRKSLCEKNSNTRFVQDGYSYCILKTGIVCTEKEYLLGVCG